MLIKKQLIDKWYDDALECGYAVSPSDIKDIIEDLEATTIQANAKKEPIKISMNCLEGYLTEGCAECPHWRNDENSCGCCCPFPIMECPHFEKMYNEREELKMLKDLIDEKINEVFAEYQKANGIVSGDIEPFDAEYLDQLEQQLADHIERVCAKQPKGKPAFYTYITDAGTHYVKDFQSVSEDKFFCEVSNIIAFSDCNGNDVIHIYFDGQKIEYTGWQPNMKFEYKDLDGNTVWVGYFPEWDH